MNYHGAIGGLVITGRAYACLLETVIVPDTEGTDGDQQSNGKDANNFLFHGQDATRTNQTDRQ